MRLTFVGLFCCVAILGCEISSAWCETPVNRKKESREPSLSQQILAAEAAGDIEKRSTLVKSLSPSQSKSNTVKSKGSDDATAFSLAGMVRHADGWKSIDESINTYASNDSLKKYEELRAVQPNTLQGHLELAQWCQRAKLKPQEVAHWKYILQLEPQNVLAHQSLGDVNMGGTWVSRETLAAMAEESTRMQESLKTYGRELQSLAAELSQNAGARLTAAKSKLMAIQSDDAIPAVTSVLSNASPNATIAAIDWLDARNHPSATSVLSQWAIFHDSDIVRSKATAVLEKRPLYEFVPQLLVYTRTPITSQLMSMYRADGSLMGVRHVFAAEDKKQNNVAVLDSTYQRPVAPRFTARQFSFNPVRDAAGSRTGVAPALSASGEFDRASYVQLMANLEEKMIQQSEAEAARQREMLVQMQNRLIETTNQRVRTVLASTIGTDSEASVQELWDTWDKHVEREQYEEKPMYFDYVSASNMNYRSYEIPVIPTHECFVAGTPVLSHHGMQAIDSLRVGDLVLTKNITSGELVWEPVITTTVQPEKSLVIVKTDQEQFHCTGGHLFWLSGRGWLKARDLKKGDILHGLTSPAVVDSVSESKPQVTYNLITASNHNYFVGTSRLLTHDFNEPTPTAVRVPGLAANANR